MRFKPQYNYLFRFCLFQLEAIINNLATSCFKCYVFSLIVINTVFTPCKISEESDSISFPFLG